MHKKIPIKLSEADLKAEFVFCIPALKYTFADVEADTNLPLGGPMVFS